MMRRYTTPDPGQCAGPQILAFSLVCLLWSSRSDRCRSEAIKAAFHHVGIVVPDLEAGIRFYSHLLGLKEEFRQEWTTENPIVEDVIGIGQSAARYAMLGGEGFRVEIFEYSAPEPRGDPAALRPSDTGLRHIGFDFDDIDAASKRFVEGGGTMHHEPVRLGPTTRAVYCRDPFGNIVELMQTN